MLQYYVLLKWCTKIRAVLTGRLTVLGFDFFADRRYSHLYDHTDVIFDNPTDTDRIGIANH